MYNISVCLSLPSSECIDEDKLSKYYLQGYKQELKATVKENEALRHSVEKWKEDASVTRYRIVSKLPDSFVGLLQIRYELGNVVIDCAGKSQTLLF